MSRVLTGKSEGKVRQDERSDGGKWKRGKGGEQEQHLSGGSSRYYLPLFLLLRLLLLLLPAYRVYSHNKPTRL